MIFELNGLSLAFVVWQMAANIDLLVSFYFRFEKWIVCNVNIVAQTLPYVLFDCPKNRQSRTPFERITSSAVLGTLWKQAILVF